MIDRTELHSLADNELPPERAQELAAQLELDSQARLELAAIKATKDCLKANSPAVQDSELWTRCRMRLEELDKARRIESFVGKYAWGICGVFFVAIAMGGFFNRFLLKSVNSSQVAGYVATMSPIPVPQSRSQSEIDPFFRQVVGESMGSRPPELRITAFGENDVPGNRLSFVRLDDGFGPVAVVALHDVQHVSGLFEYEQDSQYKYGQIDGVNALFWNRADGVICVAVGNRAYSEIHQIVTAIRE